MMSLAKTQGLTAIVLDGAQVLSDRGELSEGRSMDVKLKKQWIGTVFHNYEQKYIDYKHCIEELASFYNAHGLALMVLKGYGLSLNYPIPSHRPCGDIDIWTFGRHKDADKALSDEQGIVIDHDHDHHTVFKYCGFTVENHYDIVNIHAHLSNARIEKLFKQLAMDDSYSVSVNGQTVYIPSPNFHSLFLLRHTLAHFTAGGVSLRHILDWGVYVEKHYRQIDWDWLQTKAADYYMTEFFHCLSAICIDDLGFDAGIFPSLHGDIDMKNRVLRDILDPEFDGSRMPASRAARIIYRLRRWHANSWKYRLCYRESRAIDFIISAFGHLLKPSSI